MKITELKDKEIYPQLHMHVFGTTVQTPETVMIGKVNDEIVAFVSGHWELNGTFYIEFAGILPEFRKGGYLKYFKRILDPCVNYLTAVRNDNAVAGKTLYSVGFIPVGSRYHDDTFYIEWFKVGKMLEKGY